MISVQIGATEPVNANVAQLVERSVANAEVAGSLPVVRSTLGIGADMEHEMLLVDADFKPIARMTARRKHAPLAHQEEHRIRIPKSTVQGCDGAPQDCESE